MMMLVKMQSALFTVLYYVLALRLSDKRLAKFRVKFIRRSNYGGVGPSLFMPDFIQNLDTSLGSLSHFQVFLPPSPLIFSSQCSYYVFTLYFRHPSNHPNVPQLHCYGSYPSAETLS